MSSEVSGLFVGVLLRHTLNRDSWAYGGTVQPLGLVFRLPTASCRRHFWPWAVCLGGLVLSSHCSASAKASLWLGLLYIAFERRGAAGPSLAPNLNKCPQVGDSLAVCNLELSKRA